MLFIDTNTLYYACGLSAPTSINREKIINEIDSAEHVVITSTAFCEFLTKYRFRTATIRRVCTFMREHHIELFNDGYISFDRDAVKTLRKIRQQKFNMEFKRLLIRKIDVESRLASGIFLLVFISTTIFECDIDPYDVPGGVYDFLAHTFKKVFQPVFVEIFNITYQHAYKTKDPENYVKNLFCKYLKLFISLYMPLCKEVISKNNEINDEKYIDIPEIVENFSSSTWEEEFERYWRKIEKHSTPAHFIQRIGLNYGNRINDKHLKLLLDGLNISIEKIIGSNSLEEYYFSIVSNTLSNGGAFRKNDINDALILSCIGTPDIILSFDKGIREHMKKNSDIRKEYKNSINFINSCLL